VLVVPQLLTLPVVQPLSPGDRRCSPRTAARRVRTQHLVLQLVVLPHRQVSLGLSRLLVVLVAKVAVVLVALLVRSGTHSPSRVARQITAVAVLLETVQIRAL
jgi:hypothetical protein